MGFFIQLFAAKNQKKRRIRLSRFPLDCAEFGKDFHFKHFNVDPNIYS